MERHMVVVKNEGNDSLRASEEGAFRKGAGGGSRSTNGSSLSIQQQAGECNVVAGTSTFDKSISPTEAKQAVLNPDEGNSSSDDSGNASCSENNYLGKVSRKQHKKLKRSLGSGFELVELSQLHGDYCPPIVLQLGGVVVDPFHTSLPSSSKNSLFPGGTATVTSSRESVGSASIVLVEEEELPPEEHWRDGLLSGFFFGGSFCSIGLPSLCCTGAALLQVVRALGWHPGRTRQFFALAAMALLWASVPFAVLLHAYPLAAAALLLALAVEAAAAWRLRQIVRRRFNIDGSSALQDGVLSCLFTPCVVAQMLRHLRRPTNPGATTTTSKSGSCTHTSTTVVA